nr:lysosome-associated membrane glycoprotein 2 [Parasteatoda tepidariorum]XP_042903938.1 lysosome-associated membrane glycoprotein 2 [Parasteatoda tepidariorum]
MDKMNCVTYFTTLLFCLGFLQSLSSTPLTVEPTIINLNNSLWNGTDERNAYTLSTSAGINLTQIPVPTTSESTPPIPPDGYWNVTDGNITCIRAHLKIRFKINSENETRYLVLPPNADSSQSSCGSSQADQILLLQIDEEFDLAFTFKKDLKEHYVLENITFTLYSQEGTNHFYNDIKLFSVQKHYSYWCRSLITVSMKNVSMESFEMHIQAFGGSEKDFSQGTYFILFYKDR